MSADPGPRNQPNRCRLILIAPARSGMAALLQSALSGGDVASVVITDSGLPSDEFASWAGELVAIAQEHGAAALIEQDSRVMGRCGADGILLTQTDPASVAAAASLPADRIVGYAALTRHRALELAEGRADFLFFGRIGGDVQAQAHPKNLALGRWWAQMIEIPCVVMGGCAVDSVIAAAATGAEFVALGRAVLEHPEGARRAVALANGLLDEHAPPFDEQQ